MAPTLLVPLDGSSLSEGVLPWVEALLRARPGTRVQLLHVQSDRADSDCLAGPAERLGRAGGQVELEVCRGAAPAQEIVVRARRARAWVTMASHGRSGLTRLLLGSVAEEVLRRADGPVLLAPRPALERAGPVEYRRILVPLDGSERSAAILPLVRELARAHGAEVQLLHVASWITPELGPLLAVSEPPEALAARVDAWRAALARAGLRVETLAAAGERVEEIVAAGQREQVDLIAMATHGRAGLDRLVHGSHTEAVLRRAAVPLLSLRVEGPAP
mgnify:CR=1 FL=1